MKKTALFFYLLFSTYTSIAQVLSGRVVDAQTGYPLEAVAIFIEETFQGTVTNSDGYFDISATAFPLTLQVRYIGYHTIRKEISAHQGELLQFEMQLSVLEMQEIVFTGADPAIHIMEQVLLRKSEWKPRLTSFKAEAYTRQVLSNHEQIASITETETHIFWRKGSGYREIIQAQSQTANLSFDQNFAGASNLPNFYDDEILISGYRIPGPTHPDAFRFYEFRYEGQRTLDGQRVFDIAVIPRRSMQPLFQGQIAVLDQDYAMIETNLTPNDVVRFPPPISRFNVSYKQQFNNFGTDFWLPVDARLQGVIEISLPGLRFPPFQFQQVTRISNYQLQAEVPDSLFAANRRLIFDRERLKGTEITSERRAIPLTANEELAYENVDSTQTLQSVFEPTGPLARFARMNTGESQSVGISGNQRFRPSFWFNRVDGFTGGVQIRLPKWHGVQLDTEILYSLAQKAPYGRIALNYQPSSTMEFSLSASHRSEFQAPSAFNTRLLNSAGVLAGQPDYFDYYLATTLEAGITFRQDWIPVTPSFRFVVSEEAGMSRTTSYSLPGNRQQLENLAITEGRLHAFGARFTYGNPPSAIGFTHSNALILDIEATESDLLGGDFSFVRFDAKIDWRFVTFASRRLFPNTLDLRFHAVHSLGDLPAQRSVLLDANYLGYAPFGSFMTLRGKPNPEPHLAALYWEHNFQSLPFELVGWSYPSDKGVGIILHGASGMLHSETAMFPDAALRKTHHEVGFSVNRLFGILRVGVSKSLSDPNWAAGFAVARYF